MTFQETPLARVTGLEPATSGVTGRRSNQLSYTRSGRRQELGWVAEGVKAIQSRSMPDFTEERSAAVRAPRQPRFTTDVCSQTRVAR
jgi:hypothetical protein